MSELVLRNRQSVRSVHLPLFRRIARTLLTDLMTLTEWELGVFLVATPEMTRLNEHFLEHEGSTDVITFDYSSPVISDSSRTAARIRALPLQGEIFICIEAAVGQARRFRTTWQGELVRYLIHGVLHVCGYDDLRATARRTMKREEARLLRELSRRFSFAQLGRRKGGLRPRSQSRPRHERR